MALNKFTGRSFSRSIVFGTSVKTRDENDGSEKMTFKRLLAFSLRSIYSDHASEF